MEQSLLQPSTKEILKLQKILGQNFITGEVLYNEK